MHRTPGAGDLHDDPPLTVVGFHVEGASSPIPVTLGAPEPSAAAGSPTPVIIPPSFYMEAYNTPPSGHSSVQAEQTGQLSQDSVNHSEGFHVKPQPTNVAAACPPTSPFTVLAAEPVQTSPPPAVPTPSVSPFEAAASIPLPPTTAAMAMAMPGSIAMASSHSLGHGAGGNVEDPGMQVVGFHVEGASSPVDVVVGSAMEGTVSGSPTPVIIPPPFQAAQLESMKTSKSLSSSVQLPQVDAAGNIEGLDRGFSRDLPASLGISVTKAVQPPRQPATAPADDATPPAPSPAEPAPGSSTDAPLAPKEKRGPPADIPAKKPLKAMSKAERRSIQEAQRAAKSAAKGDDGGAAGKGAQGGSKVKAAKPAASPMPASEHKPSSGARDGDFTGSELPSSVGDVPAAQKKKASPKVVPVNSTKMFSHLQQYKSVSAQSLLNHSEAGNMHPAVLQLGLRYADGSVSGANARCLAMLHAICQVIRDYSTPAGKSMSRDLTSTLNSIISFLVECRPLSVSMGNAIKFLKMRISQIDPASPEVKAKENLEQDIADFIHARITLADRHLVDAAVTKVVTGDVILTYAYSHVVAEILQVAAQQGRQFRVIVMDSRPELEGRQMMSKLIRAGIPCTYTHINAASYIIREVTKVFLGAGAVMSNGTVVGRTGSAAVAMMASVSNKPVLVCCESYKFHERVLLDSITHNELGDPEALAHVAGSLSPSLSAWSEQPRLGLLNLKYDTMPAEYVTMIVTEFGMIPPTSVPVILREYRQEI